MKAIGEARGKVILLGEHSVVFGYPALAAALPFGVRMTATPAERGVELVGKGVPADSRVAQAAACIARVVGCKGATVQVESELPPGGGLGSSAAFAVALARALGALAGGITEELVAEAAFASETLFHGRPSGVDHAASAQEGVLLFRPGARPFVTPVLSSGEVSLVVGLTGRARLTGAKVASLRSKVDAEPGLWNPLLARMGALATAGAEDFATGDWHRLGARMDEAHEILTRCELSSPELDAIVQAAKGAGAWGAKLTGAGGGGAAIALTADPMPVARAIENAGFEVRLATLGGGA